MASVGFASVPKHRRPWLITLPELRRPGRSRRSQWGPVRL